MFPFPDGHERPRDPTIAPNRNPSQPLHETRSALSQATVLLTPSTVAPAAGPSTSGQWPSGPAPYRVGRGQAHNGITILGLHVQYGRRHCTALSVNLVPILAAVNTANLSLYQDH